MCFLLKKKYNSSVPQQAARMTQITDFALNRLSSMSLFSSV
jgi:hypothetical protein